MPEVRELPAGESHRAAPALLELRPQFRSAEAVVAAVDGLRAVGYRLIASFEDGDEDAAAVAGFRISESLAWGRYLYVDDFVTREAVRRRGHADAVMRAVEEEARRQRCDQLHLDSATSPERFDAHRFYFAHGLLITGHHFVTLL
jgi:GNAT superfamily N-acetyltransferase